MLLLPYIDKREASSYLKLADEVSMYLKGIKFYGRICTTVSRKLPKMLTVGRKVIASLRPLIEMMRICGANI